MADFAYVLIREDEDDVTVTQTYTTIQSAWAGWVFHAPNKSLSDLHADAKSLLEYEDLRSYRSDTVRMSFRLKMVPLSS